MTGVPQDGLQVEAFEPRQSIVYRVDKDGASVSRTSPERTDDELGLDVVGSFLRC